MRDIAADQIEVFAVQLRKFRERRASQFALDQRERAESGRDAICGACANWRA